MVVGQTPFEANARPTYSYDTAASDVSVNATPAPGSEGPVEGETAAGHEDVWVRDAYAPVESAETEVAGAPPGYPPVFGGGMSVGRPPRPRRFGRFVLVGLALLGTLGLGIGLGRFAFAGVSATGTSATAIGASSAPAIAVSSDITGLQQTVERVASAVEPSVVEITSYGTGSEAIGSGDILTADGYIVTNDHVVTGFSTYTVTLANGTKLAATLVGEDPQDDLAVIKVSASHLTPIAFTDSSAVTVGEFAVAIGNPLGLRETATFGDVSAINRTASESPDGPASILTGLIQTSAPIAPGNSGGALVNLKGQLIGIPTLGESSQGRGAGTSSIGLAIPSNDVKTVARQLIQSGHVTTAGHGFLGIEGQDVTPALASADGLATPSGVLIGGFANDAAGRSPARDAGLKTGDVIVSVNGAAVSDSTDLAGAVANQAPGTRVTVTVARGSSQVTVTVTLGQRPATAQG